MRIVTWNLLKLSQLWRCNGGFGPSTTQNQSTDKTICEWYKKFQQSICMCAAKRTGGPGPSAETVARAQPVSSRAKTFAQIAPDTWLTHLQFPARGMCWLLRASDKNSSHTFGGLGRWLTQFWQIPIHRKLPYPLSSTCFVTTAP
jgi:hypothetical protein